MKTATKTRTVKGMSVPKLQASAEHIVNKEIARQLSAAGRQACLDIGLRLVQVLDAYQVYFDEVNRMDIHLETIQGYFAPEVWAKLSNNQKLALEAAIKLRARAMQDAIDRHMKYLLDNRRGMDNMSPTGQAAIETRLLQLQGLGEEVAGGVQIQ